MAAVVVILDLRDRRLGLFSAMAAERIEAFALQHQPEVNAAVFTNEIIAKLWKGDRDVFLVGIVDEESSRLVGHVLALKMPLTTTYIPQVRADENVGDALERALERAEAWARENGSTTTLLATHKEPKRWRHRGYEFYRHILMLDLKKPVPPPLVSRNGEEPAVPEPEPEVSAAP